MSLFVILAILLAVLAALALAWPLLRPRAALPSAPIATVVTVLAIVAGSALVYSRLGSPASARAQPADAENQTISALARHVESAPQDQDGWMMLGAAYGQIGQFALAIRAYERADRLSHGQNADALLGIGTSMMLSGDASLGQRGPEYIERALRIDPRSPKALFYGAVVADRQGRLEVARERFAGLLSMSVPQNIRVIVQKEIDDIDSRLHPKIDESTAIHLHVTLAAALAPKVPANAFLFVFVPSPNGGPPLAVKRSEAATLPQDVALSAADSMIAGRGIQAGQKVSVVARISASGSPLPSKGDLYGQIDYVVGKSGARPLEIDKLNP
jgi:cytochrome c-type biogenesis protein CcmH